MSQTPRVRLAVAEDLAEIVRMLADDPLGAKREKNQSPLPASYLQAFEAISRDPNNELVVVEAGDGRAVAVLQLTYTPYLTHKAVGEQRLKEFAFPATSVALVSAVSSLPGQSTGPENGDAMSCNSRQTSSGLKRSGSMNRLASPPHMKA